MIRNQAVSFRSHLVISITQFHLENGTEQQGVELRRGVVQWHRKALRCGARPIASPQPSARTSTIYATFIDAATLYVAPCPFRYFLETQTAVVPNLTVSRAAGGRPCSGCSRDQVCRLNSSRARYSLTIATPDDVARRSMGLRFASPIAALVIQASAETSQPNIWVACPKTLTKRQRRLLSSVLRREGAILASRRRSVAGLIPTAFFNISSSSKNLAFEIRCRRALTGRPFKRRSWTSSAPRTLA